MSESILDDRLDMRINSADKLALFNKCAELNVSHQILMREIIQALIEDRLKIVVPKSHVQRSKLYIKSNLKVIGN
jgi:hypothetical protein